MSNLSLLRKAEEIHLAPFPYIVIDNALPEDTYNELLETRPSYEWIIHHREIEPNSRYDVKAVDSLGMGLPKIWRDFVTYHTSNDFWQDVLGVFGDCVNLAYPTLKVSGILDMHPGIRDDTGKPFFLDCLIGVNTPCIKESVVKYAHIDNPVELYAGLFYMGEDNDGGDLIINRLIRPAIFYGKNEIEEECVEEVFRVPYRHNQFFIFLNTPNSVHSVSPRNSKNPRNLVNVIGEFNFKLFEYSR